ncbi:FimV/HubP family polar landmark protein [Photobacterium salinisoli]|uniref:FimV/HubP family polar landmark protein n=1 Tax=Photobacterium salinisoli TaxID=1616783 RepID=UPI0013C4FA04|nr:FimV/HubP family polar landmark protein [Photobacterium salinisoli]
MSDSSNKMKRAILPVVIASAALQFPVAVQANTVRIMGPTDQVAEPAQPPAPVVSPAPSPRPAVTQPRVATPRPATSPGNRTVGIYGPTGENETLWSIASRYKPNDSVSIYQVLGAIFRANPNAFTDSNIHGLIPGSRLRMPTMAQIQAENTDQIRNRVEADLLRREQSRARAGNTSANNSSRPASARAGTSGTGSASASGSAPAPKPAVPAPKVQAQPTSAAASAPERPVSPAVSSTAPAAGIAAAAASTANDALSPELQEQLDTSDEELTKLRESNQLLRVRLSEMQHEIGALKEQLAGDEELRGEIQSFIAQQKAQQGQLDAPLAEQPPVHWLDKLAANPWALAGAALIPGSLIAGLLAFFFGRRRKEEDTASSAAEVSKEAPKPMVTDMDDDEPHLGLDSEDSSLDDLFDDKTPQDNPIFSDNLFDDNDAELDELDLTDGLDDAFGNELPKSDISVKNKEQAIGLQDMERALDQIDQTPPQEKEDSLSGIWDKPFSAQDNEETDFDLAVGLLDDEDVLPEKPAEDNRKDDLFDAFADSELTANKADSIELGMLDQDILNELMQDFDREGDEQHEPASPAVNHVQADSAEADWGLDDLNADFNLDASSTELLDELIDDQESEADSDFELDENSTVLLDELLDEDNQNAQLDPELDNEENEDEDKDVFDELLTLDEEEPQEADAPWLASPQETDTVSADDIDDLMLSEKKTVDEHLSELEDTEAQAGLSEEGSQAMADIGDSVSDDTETQDPAPDAHKPDADKADAEKAVAAASQAAAHTGVDEPEAVTATELEPEPETAASQDVLSAETDTQQDDIDSLLSDLQTDDSVAMAADSADSVPNEDEDIEAEGAADVDEAVPHSDASAAGFDETEAEPEPEAEPEISLSAEQDAEAEASEQDVAEQAAPDAQVLAAESAQASPDSGSTEEHETETVQLYHDKDETCQLIEQNRYQKPEQDEKTVDEAPVKTQELAQEQEQAQEQAAEPESVVNELAHEQLPTPTFDAAAEQPEATLDPAWDEAVAGRQEPVLNLEEFPEFDEEAALLDPEAVSWEDDENDKDWSDDDAQAALSKVSEQLQLAAQAVERNDDLTETVSPSEVSETPAEPAHDTPSMQETAGQAVPMHGKPQYEYAVIDPATLPEFDEDDALNASFEEQMELEQYEQELKHGDEAQAAQPQPQPPSQSQLNESWSDELIDSAGLDMAALLAEPELELPAMQAVDEFQSDETLPSMHTEDSADAESVPHSEWPELKGDNRQTDNAHAENDWAGFNNNIPADRSQPASELELSDLALSDADDPTEPESLPEPEPEPEPEQESRAEQDNPDEFEHEQWLLHESVPLSDLDDQELSPEESAIWRADIPEPELESEDWGEQPPLSEQADEPVDGADTQAESQLTGSASGKEPYISIDELMKELEGESDPELDSAPLKLDVGLDEFPDVLAGIGDIDVDGAGEYASKLDLAKAYLEMNDTDGAYFLLEDVAENGDGDVSREAANLLLKMDR